MKRLLLSLVLLAVAAAPAAAQQSEISGPSGGGGSGTVTVAGGSGAGTAIPYFSSATVLADSPIERSSSTVVRPIVDNTVDMGDATHRLQALHAVTINTATVSNPGATQLLLQGAASQRVAIGVNGAANVWLFDPTGHLTPGFNLASNIGSASLKVLSIYSGGGLTVGYLEIATAQSPYTVLATDYILVVDATAGNVTINLQAAATAVKGRVIAVKKVDASANTVTLDGDASETIDGATTKVLTTQNETTGIVSNGVSAWRIF